MEERLQKYMAKCGVASRRQCEKIILENRVKVNGEIVTSLATKVTKNDVIMVDGLQIHFEENKYYVMYKPRYVISTVKDEKGRKSVISILPKDLQEYRLFPVGRLDYDTKGVLLLTNDGQFMNNLVGPNSNTEKEYLARVKGIVSKEEAKKLSNGVMIDGYLTKKSLVLIEDIDHKNNSTLLRITITEGKYHQIKNMCAAIGHEVKKLTRVRFGVVTIEGLKEGDIRPLTIHEIKTLYADSLIEKEYKIQKTRKYS